MDTRGTRVVEYTYDSWGKLLSTIGTLATTLGADNPFRYRDYYYDTEAGLYYLQSRYYDPEVCRFISADVYMSTGQGIVANNMFAYCLNNPANMFDSTGRETNWTTLLSGTQLLLTAAIALATVATVMTGGCAAPLLLVVVAAATATAATVCAVNGTAEVIEAFTGENFVRDGFMGGDVEQYETIRNGAAIAAGIGSMVLGMYSPTCFIEGTPVITENGAIPIEEIEAGMLVYACNPDTGEMDLREVVQTFESKSSELVHVYTDSDNEIITTPTHPFYTPKNGGTAAIALRAGDILVTVNGAQVVVEKVEHELLENPVTVYNFEVEGLHTYYVGTDEVLVHNMCKPVSPKKIDTGYLKKIGIDAHKLKAEYLTAKNRSLFDIYIDTVTGIIWLADKAQKIWIQTESYMEDFLR